MAQENVLLKSNDLSARMNEKTKTTADWLPCRKKHTALKKMYSSDVSFDKKY